jgi:hypothetical protein
MFASTSANILSFGVIPSPKKPIDIDSFLWPAIVEFLKLAHGVQAFDGISLEYFLLRAYLIVVFGDIPAVSMLMHMKGHNALCPCRMCRILGVRVPGTRGPSSYYIPLERSSHPKVILDHSTIKKYDPRHLPMRTPQELLQQAREVQQATTNAAAEALAKKFGIKSLPILSEVHSLHFPTSFPYDFMHLIWENLVKNLVIHWTGEFKGLDDGKESYQIEETCWDAIGAATFEAGQTIPSVYGPRVPNISSESRAYISAEMWSFWTLYLAPVLLRRRFKEHRYYTHFVRLVYLLNICLQFEIMDEEIDEVESGFIDWVEQYEK